MAKGIKRCADASSLDAVNAGAVLKKNRQGSDGLSSDSTSFQDVSKNILALCAEFEVSVFALRLQRLPTRMHLRLAQLQIRLT